MLSGTVMVARMDVGNGFCWLPGEKTPNWHLTKTCAASKKLSMATCFKQIPERSIFDNENLFLWASPCYAREISIKTL